jgi:hypothetical protein
VVVVVGQGGCRAWRATVEAELRRELIRDCCSRLSCRSGDLQIENEPVNCERLRTSQKQQFNPWTTDVETDNKLSS